MCFSKEKLSSTKELISDKSPGFFKALFEVIVTVAFTFLPFAILSIKWLKSDGENTAVGAANIFWGYWQAGEIVLPILGLCGAVTALLALNVGYFSWWVHALVGLLVLVLTIAGGAVLIGTGGMKEVLNSEVITFGFWGYAILAATWLTLITCVRVTEPKPRVSDHKARVLLDDVNAKRDRPGEKA